MERRELLSKGGISGAARTGLEPNVPTPKVNIAPAPGSPQAQNQLAHGITIDQNPQTAGFPGTTTFIPQPSQAQIAVSPTPAEARREQVTVYLTAAYRVAPPRFTNQIATTVFVGKGISNFSVHPNTAMLLYVPKDPSQPLTGEGVISDQRNDNSLVPPNLALVIQGDPQLDNGPLPTHLTWGVNGLTSTSTWAGAAGQGTMDIQYIIPKGHTTPSNVGYAKIAIHGLVNTSGLALLLKAVGKPKVPTIEGRGTFPKIKLP